MTRVLAVDGNSVAHRAYHATGPDERDGPFVVAGVLRAVARVWGEGPYDGVVIAFDDPDDNRRKHLYPGYKAQRTDKDDLLVRQLAGAADVLRACGLVVATSAGAEADDLVAATATACGRRGWSCDVLSSDRDLLALVCEDVRVLQPREGGVLVLDTVEVVRRYGVRPEQYTDFAALRGDPSDGLPGVRGIGPKTAARLVRTYGSATAVYDHLTSLPPSVEAKLRAGREHVERNLLLMAPLPRLDVDVDRAVACGVDPGKVAAVMDPVGHGATTGILRWALNRPEAPPAPPPPDAPAPGEPTGSARDGGADRVIDLTGRFAETLGAGPCVQPALF